MAEVGKSTLMVWAIAFGGIGAFLAPWIVWYLRRPDAKPWRSVGVVLLVAVILLALYLELVSAVVRSSHSDYSATRLAVSVAMAHGYQPYRGPDQGPMTLGIYGPVHSLTYFSCAMAATPNGALLMAGTISVLLLMVPVLLLHLLSPGQGYGDGLRVLTGFAFAAGAILLEPPIAALAGLVQADVPALGLGLLACVVLTYSNREPGWSRLAFSALLSLLATWAKQVDVAIIPALGIFLWLVHGRRSFLRFVAVTAVLGVISVGVFAAAFGWTALFFNLFTVPASHPWIAPPLRAISGAVLELGKPALPFAVIALIGIARAGQAADWDLRKARTQIPNHAWFLPLLVAILMVPTSIVGRVKWGGWLSAYHCLYYLICAASLILVEWSRPSVSERRHVICSWGLVAASLFVLAAASADLKTINWIEHPEMNPQQQAYEFALKHPGEVYFPWNPLSTLMAEGKLYNMEHGVVDKELAGYKPSDKLFRAHLPERLKYVAYPRSALSESMLEYLPEFSRKVHVEGLPGWNVYTRPETNLEGMY